MNSPNSPTTISEQDCGELKLLVAGKTEMTVPAIEGKLLIGQRRPFPGVETLLVEAGASWMTLSLKDKPQQAFQVGFKKHGIYQDVFESPVKSVMVKRTAEGNWSLVQDEAGQPAVLDGDGLFFFVCRAAREYNGKNQPYSAGG